MDSREFSLAAPPSAATVAAASRAPSVARVDGGASTLSLADAVRRAQDAASSLAFSPVARTKPVPLGSSLTVGTNPAGAGFAVERTGGGINGALTLAALARPRTGIVPEGSNLIVVRPVELPRRAGTSAGTAVPGLLIAAPSSLDALTRGPTSSGAALPTQAMPAAPADLDVSDSMAAGPIQSGGLTYSGNGDRKDCCCCCCCPKDTPSGGNTVWSEPKVTYTRSGRNVPIPIPAIPDTFSGQAGGGQPGVTYSQPGQNYPPGIV